jgi:hypothetical protein
VAKTKLVKQKSKATTDAPAMEYFVDVSLPVPPEARHLIDDPMLKLRYGAKSGQIITQASNSLTISRRLDDGASISGGHPYVLILARQQKNRAAKDLIRDVQMIYQGWANELRSDVITIAMFAENKLLNLPTPYDETDDAEENAPMFEWMMEGSGQVKLPDPERDIQNNAFERRLKQIVDFLDACGWEFGLQVENAINEGILASIRGLGEETDENNFQPDAAGGDVHEGDVAADLAGGSAAV